MNAEFIPKPYQKQGIEWFLSKSFAGLFWPPGLGKTAVALFAFDMLKKLGYVDTMYVVSTKKIISNTWPREIKKWVPHLSHVIVSGPPQQRIQRLELEADIYLISLDNMKWFVDLVKGKRKKIKGRWRTLPPEREDLTPTKAVLTIDESSKFRNSGNQRFKQIKRILENFLRRYILTGSPAPRSLLNLWGQMYIVDLGESLGEYITNFRMKYFHPAGYKGYDWVLNPKADKKIYKAIADRILRVGEGVLKMPKLSFYEREVSFEEVTETRYKEMEREFIIEIENEKITAANAGVKTQKLRQLANGFVYAPDKTFSLDHAKAEEVYDLYEELQGTPLLVGYIYNEDIAALREVFGNTATYITANTSEKDFNQVEKKWNDGKVEVLIGQINILSHGLNLQGTHAAVVYYSIPWDLEAYEQFYRRVWRQGQKKEVLVYHVVRKDSVDDKVVLPSIKAKDKTQQKLLSNLEKYMERRKKFTRPETLTRVGNKTGMQILADTMLDCQQTIPRVKTEVADPGGVLMSIIMKRVKQWGPDTRLEFCQKVTGNDDYSGKSDEKTVKAMVEEIFWVTPNKKMPPEVFKMWRGYNPKRRKKMPTAKKPGFGSSKKKASKKKASKKKVAKKKVTKKKVSKKKVSKKKTAAKSTGAFKAGDTYVAGSNDATPKMAARKTIADIVRDAKGRGVKGDKLIDQVREKHRMKEDRIAGHVDGCLQMNFIKAK